MWAQFKAGCIFFVTMTTGMYTFNMYIVHNFYIKKTCNIWLFTKGFARYTWNCVNGKNSRLCVLYCWSLLLDLSECAEHNCVSEFVCVCAHLFHKFEAMTKHHIPYPNAVKLWKQSTESKFHKFTALDTFMGW